jgi:hypothetical protein
LSSAEPALPHTYTFNERKRGIEMTVKMKLRWTEEGDGQFFCILHSDALAQAGESKCYARVLRIDLAPDVQRALSNGQAVAMEIDEAALIESPKQNGDLWPHA